MDHLRREYNSDRGAKKQSYALTITGTLGIMAGTFICAAIVEAGTKEEVWRAADPEAMPIHVMWLQRGKNVGDQAFDSYAIYGTKGEQKIRVSRKSNNTTHLELWTLVGSSLTVVNSFVAEADQLSNAIETILNHLYRPNGDVVIKTFLQNQEKFELTLGVSVSKEGSCGPTAGDVGVSFTRKRSDDTWTPWKADNEKIRAVLSLWLSYFSQPGSSAQQEKKNLWVIGPDDDLTDILYDWWIYRGTEKRRQDSFELDPRLRSVVGDRVFDLRCRPDVMGRVDGSTGQISILTSDSLPRACSQYLLGCFLKSVIGCVEKLNGKTSVAPGVTSGEIHLMNDSVQLLAETLHQGGGGIVSLEDAHRLLVPSLSDAGLLPDALDVLEDKKAKLQSEQDRWAGTGATFRKLIDTFSDALGPYAPETARATDAMQAFAADFIDWRTTASARQKDRLRSLDELFWLHAASRHGLIGQVLQGVLDGLGVDTWDDEHETPISLVDQARTPGHHSAGHVLWCARGPPAGLMAIEHMGQTLQAEANQMILRLLLLNFRDEDNVLLEACMTGHGNTAFLIDILLESGIDATAKNKDGLTPVHIASNRGKERVVQALLEKKVDLEAQTPLKQTALHLAVLGRHESVVGLVLHAGSSKDARDSKKRTCLHLAAEEGQLDMARLLVKHGFDVNARDESGRTMLHISVTNSDAEMVQWLLSRGGVDVTAKDNDQSTALHQASRLGSGTIAQMMVEQAAGRTLLQARDKYGSTPFVIAGREDGREAVLRTMAEHGARMDAREEAGQGALEYAALMGHLEAVRFLVGRDVTARHRDGFKRTALHYAAWCKNTHSMAIAVLLLAHDAAVNAADKDGWTALHYACCVQKEEMVALLLASGADATREDRLGRTARSYQEGEIEINFWTRALPPPYPPMDIFADSF
ncbi:ankyrin repeat protein [Grosmannia clavigera kw1407]|uniref:Ankyrin repeat protein n=1 Tax=Grosmannia clavigera (strain kw1407 / UAMH 11150) TaxID=655863 RepID=F0XKT8_GROCL|nr:ankyrin repeat protein [Grosmannia clavigera kw1407]EFX01610.1 ankyrin repeat protein [Grosmannia clavigera kw1407]